MSSSQLIIKTVLIALFAIMGIIMIFPRQGARPLAIRRLVTLLFIAAAILAVLNPEWLSQLAAFVGVGRGTDLVLYVLVVLFFGQMVATRTHSAATDRKITDLARAVAISRAPDPATAVTLPAGPDEQPAP